MGTGAVEQNPNNLRKFLPIHRVKCEGVLRLLYHNAKITDASQCQCGDKKELGNTFH